MNKILIFAVFSITLTTGNTIKAGNDRNSINPEIPSKYKAEKETIHEESNIIYVRNRLTNCRSIFQQKKQGRVAFIGGSITQNKGWRDHVCNSLKLRFPETCFDFINAGVSSTDSTWGAFRIQNDVFLKGKVDLLFVDFAVNDQYNGRSNIESIRAMEGIVQKALKHNQYIDIIFLYFYDPAKKIFVDAGKIPPVIDSHEYVADYYHISSIDAAKLVSLEINRDGTYWEKFGANIHPGPFGGRVYANAVEELFDKIWHEPLSQSNLPRLHDIPKQCLDTLNYSNSMVIEPNQAELVNGWQHIDVWKPKSGQIHAHFNNIPILETTEPNAVLRLNFTGTAIGLLVLAGPDAGILEYSIDGDEFKLVDQFTQWSSNLHLPWVIMLNADMRNVKHELILRTTNQKNLKSQGYVSRIIKFLVNGANSTPFVKQ